MSFDPFATASKVTKSRFSIVDGTSNWNPYILARSTFSCPSQGTANCVCKLDTRKYGDQQGVSMLERCFDSTPCASTTNGMGQFESEF